MRNADFRSSPHLAIIILKEVRMHRKFRKFPHGGPCNIVPGPRGLTGTEHPRLFPDLCGPDFLIQGFDHRESVFCSTARAFFATTARAFFAPPRERFLQPPPGLKSPDRHCRPPGIVAPREVNMTGRKYQAESPPQATKMGPEIFVRGSPKRNRQFPVASENFRSPEKRPEICLEDVSGGMRISGRHPIWRL